MSCWHAGRVQAVRAQSPGGLRPACAGQSPCGEAAAGPEAQCVEGAPGSSPHGAGAAVQSPQLGPCFSLGRAPLGAVDSAS